MNFKKFALDYLLFAIIVVGLLAFVPPILTPMLGATLGTYTSYVVTALVAMAALWLHRKVKTEV